MGSVDTETLYITMYIDTAYILAGTWGPCILRHPV